MVTKADLAARLRVTADWDDADGLRTYEQVARWLSPDVRAAIEAGQPDGLRRSDDGVRHGSHAGFTQHRARREQPCRACQRAQSAYRAQAHRLRIT
jgi:hypothetical protein